MRQQVMNRVFFNPGLVMVLGLSLTIGVGTFLLALPWAHYPTAEDPVHWFTTALFTATSAACVTGLNVIDPATYYTIFGQVVIAVLIQLGGLGVMVCATLLGRLILKRSRREFNRTATRSIGIESMNNPLELVAKVVRLVLIIEGAGALVLSLWLWLHWDLGFIQALGQGVFLSVSAFNNAGFVLYSDNLMSFVGDPVVLLTVGALIIVGGLGYPLLLNLGQTYRTSMPRYNSASALGLNLAVLRPYYLHRWWRRLNASSRMVLAGTAYLLVIGTALVALIEWNNARTFGRLSIFERLSASFFTAVSPRTAGFNHINIADLHMSAILLIMVLMFVGAGSAGTAGGVKISTVTVLWAAMRAEIRGHSQVQAYGCTLRGATIRQALSVVMLSLLIIFSASTLLLLFTGFSTRDIVFEVISAFSTVGLTTGITPDFSPLGRLILVALMFLGRIGPLTFASSLELRRRADLVKMPSERPLIG